ncbi:MAG: molybdopterin-synthase adenylyltransferase MoeB [Bryobacter sp.]
MDAKSQQRAQRYVRQQRFGPLGEAGQQRLAGACVALVGCGALGTTAASLLARAGVGHLKLIDRDTVEWSNLPRQTLFTEADAEAGELKAIAAARQLKEANSEIRLEPQVADLTGANIEEVLEGVDLVLDATDNFETRYLLNDYCVSRGVPWIYGAAVGSYGLAFPVLPGRGPCLRCIYPHPPEGVQPTCETAGVLNTIPALVATWQVAWATRILVDPAVKDLPVRLTTWESWNFESRQIVVRRDPDCLCCGNGEYEYLDGSRRRPISLCGRDAVQIHERSARVDLAAVEASLVGLGQVKRNEFALRFTPTPELEQAFREMMVFPDGRAIVKGTTDPKVARSAYARYLGR